MVFALFQARRNAGRAPMESYAVSSGGTDSPGGRLRRYQKGAGDEVAVSCAPPHTSEVEGQAESR